MERENTKTVIEKRQQVGWVLYDFSNSTYHLMIPTVLIPLFFRQYLAVGATSPDLLWALVVSLPVVLAGFVGPAIGAAMDIRNQRFAGLIASSVVSILIVVGLVFTKEGNLVLGAALFSSSYFFFTIALGLYDAFLPIVATKKRRGSISGLAWGVGYLGGIVAVAIVFPFLKDAQLPADASSFRTSIILVAVLFAVFAGVAFVLMRGVQEPSEPESASAVPRSVYSRILSTLRNWRSNPEFFKTLISYYLANDGLSTLVYFTSIYAASTLGFSTQQILMLFLVVQLVGVPASAGAGYLADRWSHKSVLTVALLIWIGLVVGYSFGEGITTFYALSAGTGLVIGSTPAVYRSLLSSFVPKERTAEAFGYNAFASRASAVLGPLIFGAIATATGNQRIAMFSLFFFFGVAVWVLQTIREDETPS